MRGDRSESLRKTGSLPHLTRMRRFRDSNGHDWDVVVGRESWGAFFALFVPGAHSGEIVRQTLLEASTQEAAERELDTLDGPALAALFERSTPKEL